MKDIDNTFPCPVTHLHCTGECPNNGKMVEIFFPLDLTAAQLQQQAEALGYHTEADIVRYVSNHREYIRMATLTEQAINALPRDQCNPRCLS